mmetsp:Transcript_12555/g.12176  ORF Transcript_12555/g.12176 Transcript_12555/m.12176 type:complete len:282 (-) Transcript_12555:2085-2930(-)
MRSVIILLVMLNVSKGFHNVISVHRLAKYMTTSMSSIAEGYLSVHVKGRISPGAASSEVFYKNTIQNAKQSVLEDGISRFDVLNRIDNNDEFLLVEVYNSANGPGDHKLTSHYNSWRENVADLMAEPRSAAKYTTLFPPKSNWKTDATASTIDDDSFMKKIPWNSDPFVNSLNSATGLPSPSKSMLAVAVDVEVTEGTEDLFIAASIENCKNSVREPGVTRFDFMQNNERPTNFLLFEVYNNAEAPLEHKATAHYTAWAGAVKDLMARPRTAIKYATKYFF